MSEDRMCEILIYCFRFGDCIYIRKGKENIKLDDLTFKEATEFILEWIENNFIPHRIVDECNKKF